MRKAFLVACVILLLASSAQAKEGSFLSKLPKVHGFLEEAYAPRFGADTVKHRQYNMAEGRLQLKTNYYFSGDNLLSDWQTALTAKCDFILDLYAGGKVLTDLRELNASFTPTDIIDIKIGRQVMTWGTGRLFISE